MNNQQKAQRFGRNMAARVNQGLFARETAVKLCNDFGYSHASQPAAQDRMSYWARIELRRILDAS